MRKPIHEWNGLTRTWVTKLVFRSLGFGWQRTYWINVPHKVARDCGLKKDDYVLFTLNFFNTRKDLQKYIKKSGNWRAGKVRTIEELSPRINPVSDLSRNSSVG